MKLRTGAAVVLLSLGVTTLVAACGGDEAKEAAQAKQQQETAAQDTFLDTYCQIILKCCNVVLSLPKTDIAGCKTRLAQVDPVMLKEPAARDACLAQARAATPLTNFCEDFERMDIPACPDPRRAALVGTKKVGEGCASAAECAPAFDGVVTCAGTCSVRKRGQEGDGPCDVTIDGDVVTSLAESATGDQTYECFLSGDGLQCDPDSKKCVTPLVAKSVCTDSGQCAPGLFCDSEEKKCFAHLAKDNVCTADDECSGHCEEGFCAVKSKAGQPCKTNAYCVEGFACVDGSCQAPGADVRLAATCQ